MLDIVKSIYRNYIEILQEFPILGKISTVCILIGVVGLPLCWLLGI